MSFEKLRKQWAVLLLTMSLMLLAGAALADEAEGSKTLAEAKQKAKEAMEKVQADVKNVDTKSVDDAKKLASDKVAKGKESLSKQMEKVKNDVEAAKKKAGESVKSTEEGSDKAVGESAHPGQHLAKGADKATPGKKVGAEKNAALTAQDTDAVDTDDAEAEKLKKERRSRRELSYIMHKRYLKSNEAHQNTMKAVADKKDPIAMEQRKHIRRIARLERVKELAGDTKDTATIERADALQQLEIQRHENATVQIHKRAKAAAQQGEKRGE